MQHRALQAASLAAFVISAALARTPAAACPVSRGAPLLLVSPELNPDVFLWDSSDRLVRYETGDYDVETVLKHTTLVKAYSRAVAVSCKNTTIRPQYQPKAAGPFYLVGVKVATGRFRGRYGWVMSTDIRGPDGRQLTLQSQRH